MIYCLLYFCCSLLHGLQKKSDQKEGIMSSIGNGRKVCFLGTSLPVPPPPPFVLIALGRKLRVGTVFAILHMLGILFTI